MDPNGPKEKIADAVRSWFGKDTNFQEDAVKRFSKVCGHLVPYPIDKKVSRCFQVYSQLALLFQYFHLTFRLFY